MADLGLIPGTPHGRLHTWGQPWRPLSITRMAQVVAGNTGQRSILTLGLRTDPEPDRPRLMSRDAGVPERCFGSVSYTGRKEERAAAVAADSTISLRGRWYE